MTDLAEKLAEKCVQDCNHGKKEESVNFACESCIYDIINKAISNTRYMFDRSCDV